MPAGELLERAIAAHGGRERFERTERIAADLHVGGVALPLRFQRGKLSDYTGEVWTREPRAVLEPYPAPGRRGVFERDRVRIESLEGEVLAERADPRAAFGGRRNLWWDDLDLLYFAGYALWGYVVAPFVLTQPGYTVEDEEPWREGGETWQGIRVTFPANVPAHSRVQSFWFGPDGLIRRNDYTAEVFGGWATAAHYCFDYREFDGFMVPTRRRAMPRGPSRRPVRAVALVKIAIDAVRAFPPNI
jgi:hypothetical protein